MVELTGMLLAVLAACFFGTYFVPLKRIKNVDHYHYQFFIGISAMAISILTVVVLGISFQVNIPSIITGVMWTIGNLLVANSFKYVGLSKIPIANGTIVLVSFFLGLVILQEPFQSVILALVGLSILLLGLPLVAIRGDGTKNLMKGIILLISGGFIWGTMFAIPLLYKIQANSIILSMALGVFLSGLFLFAIGRRKIEIKAAYNSLLSGVIWTIGNVFNIIALGLIGLALTGPLTQLVILVNIGWGLFYFKEVKSTDKMVKIIIGGIMLVIGAILLSSSK